MKTPQDDCRLDAANVHCETERCRMRCVASVPCGAARFLALS